MIFLKLLEPLGADFVVYFEAAKVFLAGGNPYLGLITRAFPFNYPPFSLLLLSPLALFDFATANILWNLLSTAAVVASICLMGKIAGIRKIWWPVLVLLFTVFFFPVKFNIGNGQINHFLLLSCSLSLYFYQSKRRKLSALFLALAAVIKFAPAIFLLYFVLLRDWRQIRSVLAFVLVLTGLSLIFIPPVYQLVYWRDVLPLSFTTGAKDWYYNQSLWGFLARSLPAAKAAVLFYPLATLILFLTWWRGRKIPKIRALAAVGCLYLLIHPIALQHYFGFAIIPFILLLSRRDWLALLIAYLLLAFNIKAFDQVPKQFSFVLSHDFYGVLILWLLALWREKFWQVATALWAGGLSLAYVYFLSCRAGFC